MWHPEKIHYEKLEQLLQRRGKEITDDFAKDLGKKLGLTINETSDSQKKCLNII
jgi:hypothetical protein